MDKPKFCNPRCSYLVPTEEEQDRSPTRPRSQHLCTKYHKPVMHRGWHPELVALTECEEENVDTPPEFVFLAIGTTPGGRQVHATAFDHAGVIAKLVNSVSGTKVERVIRYKQAPECIVCQKDVDEDAYCHGCQSYVCDNCAVSHPMGTHTLEDHFKEDEDED